MANVDVWHVRTDALDAETVEACIALMTREEREQHARFLFDRHRHEYLVTRGLACGVLATYLARLPSELRFYRTEHGRPLIENVNANADADVGREPVAFNLSNTVTLVVCAVARSREIGVDTEPLTRADDVLRIADTVFTAAEQGGLAALPLAARRRRAVELWTLKEAYIKARGLGMSLPIKRIELVFGGADSPPTLRFFPPVEDARRWSLATVEVEGHLVSTCTELAAGEAAGALEIALRRADLAELLRAPR